MPTKSPKALRQKKSSFPRTEKSAARVYERVRVLNQSEGILHRVVMTGDGRIAYTSGNHGLLRRWELEGEQPWSRLVFSADRLFGLAMTNDGKTVAVSEADGRIHILDGDSSAALLSIPVDRAFERESSQIEEIDDFESRGRQEVGSRRRGLNHVTLAFAADGRELVGARNSTFSRWRVSNGEILAQWRLRSQSNRCGVAVSVASGRIVGTASGEGIWVWDRQDLGEMKFLKEDVDPNTPVCLPNDDRIAFTGTLRSTVTKWDLTEGRRIAAFEGHSSPVRAVAVTPDGRYCVSGDANGEVRLWAAETGQCLGVLLKAPPFRQGKSLESNFINGLAITLDGRRVASVGSDGSLRVWDIPQSVLDTGGALGRRGYMNAKVVLLGDSGVGKTGLALRLWHDRWKKTESTHGMEIKRLVLPSAGEEVGVEREIWLWDLAGQPDYRLTHQLFMEQTSLAMLVFDPQGLEVFATLGYWQSALRKVTHAENIAGILVAARCDRPGLRLTMGEISEWAAARGLQGPILTAAKLKSHGGAIKLRDLIGKLLPWDKMEFRSTMANFPSLKDAILVVRDEMGAGVVVTFAELETRVRRAAPHLEFSSDDLRAVTGLLAGEGVLHALPYGGLFVMQPSWVNSYASTLVKLAGEAEDQLGHVPLAIIQPGQLPDDGTPRLKVEDERQLLPALVALFLRRALAWKQNTDKGEMLVFPNYVRLPRPIPPPRPGRTVIYRFSGPLEEIYCTLVVRLRYSGLFAKSRLYRQAVDFETATHKLAALTMRELGERGELEIYFGAGLDADVQAAFQFFVHDHLQAKASGLERLRNYFCPRCREQVDDRKAIDNALKKKRTKIICNRCDPADPALIDLHDVLEEQFSSKAGEAGADEAARKASEEITSASKEGVMVGEVQAIVFSADQIYRTIAEPDEGVDGEIEFRSKRKKSTGITYRVQLKSGDSHLEVLRDGTERFSLKAHYEDLWAGEGRVPLILIIRSSDGRIRFMNATDAIRTAKRVNPDRPVSRITFDASDFTKDAVLRLRDERLK